MRMTTLVVARFPKTQRIASNTEGRIPSGTTPVRGTTKTKAYDDACPGQDAASGSTFCCRRGSLLRGLWGQIDPNPLEVETREPQH